MTSTRNGSAGSRRDLLGIYLNDHLAGAAGGLALARRVVGSHRGSSAETELVALEREIAEDRSALIEIMQRLDVRRTVYKEPLARVAELLGRAKLNGSVLQRSPLSSLVELEGLTLGVTGKASGWRLLRRLCDVEPALDAGQLDRLIARADGQLEVLEQLRIRFGLRALTTHD